jgi:hypothetical protein
MGFFLLGEFRGFTLNCEENSFGGIEIWELFGVWAWVHVDVLRRGGLCVHFGGICCAPCVGFCGLY